MQRCLLVQNFQWISIWKKLSEAISVKIENFFASHADLFFRLFMKKIDFVDQIAPSTSRQQHGFPKTIPDKIFGKGSSDQFRQNGIFLSRSWSGRVVFVDDLCCYGEKKEAGLMALDLWICWMVDLVHKFILGWTYLGVNLFSMAAFGVIFLAVALR